MLLMVSMNYRENFDKKSKCLQLLTEGSKRNFTQQKKNASSSLSLQKPIEMG